MKICYFGTYEKDYPRNSVLIQGLKKGGIEVSECHAPLWEKKRDKTKLSFIDKMGIFLKLPFIYMKLGSEFRKLDKKDGFDCIIVGYIGQIDMLAIHLIAKKGTKIIFNPMVSLYDTLVNDRKMSRNPLMKKILHWLDRKACRYADLVVLDTEEHAAYFRKEFGLKNVDVLYIGADEMFKPIKQAEEKSESGVFKVLFYGKYTPLHGTEYIIRTAKTLEKQKDIKFEIIGRGQTYDEDMQIAKKLNVNNVKFTDWIDYKKLPQKIAESDVCLGGHFGKGDKALRVVPNKVFQIIAMAKPVIVNGGSAMKQAGFVENENCVFAKPADPRSISQAILKLKNDDELRDRISENAYALYSRKFSAEKIAQNLVEKIKKLKKD